MLDPSSYPCVSVVVPTYNNETRIAFTLESIIAQDYQNLEIIVVNDASTDETEKIANKTLKGSLRNFLVVNHSENMGVSVARNTGLGAARGEYIWFCDGDDMAEKKFVSTLIELIMKYDCDIAFGGVIDRFEDGRPDRFWPVKISEPQPLSGETVTYLRVLKRITPHFCCTLFRKAFLVNTGLRFEKGCTAGQDVEFQIKAFCRAEKAAFTPECLYVYFHHSGMGQVRDRNTNEKRLRRYQDNTDAHFRTAEYLSCYAPSKKIKSIADNLLMPEAMVRRFTVYAKKGDSGAFKKLLQENDTKEILRRSRKFLFQKPEVFFKAFSILHFPDLYYRIRRGRVSR